MAETVWTRAQLDAILAKDRHILVSAAAGSGKTAVLVERVVRMLTREEEPLDIDRLLIMTFTKAAAAQMRTKIFLALKEKLQEHPERLSIRQQMMKLQNARICTIDSLCSSLVRDHFQDVDLDPGFRIADEAQIRMLQKDTLAQLLEEAYEEGSEDFLSFADYYMDKNDKKLEEIILTLYRFSESHPEPYAWLRACVYPYMDAAESYEPEKCHDYPLTMQQWMPVFARLVNEKLTELLQMAELGLSISRMNHGPAPYEADFAQVRDFLLSLSDQSFDYRKDALDQFLAGWQKAPAIRKSMDVDPDLKDQAADLRKEIKSGLEDIQEQFLYDDLDGIFRDMAACSGTAQTIAAFTLKFCEAFALAKKERTIADFSDIAHYALQILIRYDEEGNIVRDEQGFPLYTETADLLAGELDEIIVDEYQDTNMLQEYLVNALSSERFGRPNVFMVGDVKQSIYGFRMACPELFTEKMADYRSREEAGELIVLDRNFRSHKEVLLFTNRIFRQAMIPEIGGIDYRNDQHDLIYSGLYGEDEEADPALMPEVLLFAGSGEQIRLLEGYEIAKKIEELTHTGGYSYSDIVILTRTSDNPEIEKTLSERSIPLIKQSGKGFFDTFEIRLLLNLLRIIDNPEQDIPFAAVLYSPLAGADGNDLARIRLAGAEMDSLFACAGNYEGHPGVTAFLENLAIWRQKASYMGICEFLDYVVRASGLRQILSAMPGGEDRLANLEFLNAAAQSFAKGSYTGLFSFLRYIEELQDNEIDFGAVNSVQADANAVRLMTIHRSKGLEFPVVILAGCGRKFNESDLQASVIPDRTLGLGLELRDTDSRMIRKTVLMQVIRQAQKKRSLAEELRLLYVALTRAKEKLIITGCDPHLETRTKKWEMQSSKAAQTIPPARLLQAGSFLAVLGMTLYPFRNEAADFSLQIITQEDMEEARVEEMTALSGRQEKILQMAAEPTAEPSWLQAMKEPYPYLKAANIQGKIAASMLENREAAERKGRRFMPAATEEELLSGAQRGTAYHTFFEQLDYDRAPQEMLKLLTAQRILNPQEAASVDPDKICTFLESDLGQRMKQAFHEGRLFREKPFVAGYLTDINQTQTLTGAAYHSVVPDEELLLVQGIIDAFFIETDPQGVQGLVLVDYKTDRNTDPQYYIHTYYPQLKAYADALSEGLAMPVKEMYIYSLELGQAIPVNRKEEKV